MEITKLEMEVLEEAVVDVELKKVAALELAVIGSGTGDVVWN